MLQIIPPFTFIPGSVLMDINSISIGLVVKPFSFENVAINVPELAMSASLIESPMSLILSSVLPNLNSISMLHISEPLASVGCSIFEVNFSSLIELSFINIIHVDIAHIIVLELFIYYLSITIAHVVLVLGVHLT
jgi:hypothetical protein